MAEKKFLMFEERKFIIVIDDVELDKLIYASTKESKDGVASRKLLQNAKQLKQSDPLFQNLEKYNSGDVLVQNPYNQLEYFYAIEADTETAKISYLNFASLCQRLGCKSFKIVKVYAKDSNENVVASLNFNNLENSNNTEKSNKLLNNFINNLFNNAKLEVSNERTSKLESTFKFDESYPFKNPNPEKAKKFLEENLMTKERIPSRFVKDALDEYIPTSSNYKFFASSEFQRTLKFIGSFKMPQFFTTCNLNFEMIKKELYLYEIEINIEFYTDLERLNEGAVSRLIESLKRHGVRDEVIREVVSDVT